MWSETDGPPSDLPLFSLLIASLTVSGDIDIFMMSSGERMDSSDSSKLAEEEPSEEFITA